MNEAETRAELIDPKLKACGWGVADAVADPEGRIKQTNVKLNLYQVEYQVQHHLRNTRVMFST